MKFKLLFTALFVLAVANKNIYAIDTDEEGKEYKTRTEHSLLLHTICSSLGFGEDTYSWWWDDNSEHKYSQQVLLRFHKAKKCAVIGIPILCSGAFTLEAETGALNPFFLFFTEDPLDLDACNLRLGTSLEKLRQKMTWYNHEELRKMGELNIRVCETYFPQEQPAKTCSFNMGKNFRILNAVGMMMHGSFLSACGLVHLGCALFGACQIVGPSIYEKFIHKKSE